MKQYLKFLMLLVLSLALIAGINSCGKESSGGIEPTPVNPTPNNGGGGGKPDPEKPDDKPIGDGKVKVFEQVVAVQESEITSVKSDTAAHHYTITYNNAAPEIKPGNVVVVQDGDDVRIILVTEAKVNGSTAELEGPLGDISYVFKDAEFILTNSPDNVENAQCPIYTPFSEKSYYDMLNQGTSKSKKETKDDSKFKIDSLKFTPLYGLIGDADENTTSVGFMFGFELGCKVQYGENLTIKPKLKNENEYSFMFYHKQSGVKVEKVGNVQFDRATEIENGFSLVGKNSFDLSLEMKVEKEIKVNGDNFEILPCLSKDMWFPVGGWFPVRLILGADVMADLSAEAKAGVGVKGSVGFEYTGEIGIARTPDGECAPILKSSPKFKKPKFSASLQGSASLKFAPIYPMFYCMLVDESAIGLGIKLKPQVNYDAGVIVEETWEWGKDKSSEITGYHTEMSGGIYLELGTLRRPTKFEQWWSDKDDGWEFTSYIDGRKENGNWSFEFKKDGGGQIELAKWTLFEFPYGLSVPKISSKDATMKLEQDYNLDTIQTKNIKENNVVYFPIKKDVPVSIDLRVIGNLFNGLSFDALPSFINISTKKQNDLLFRTSTTYVWIPESDDDYFEAALYDFDKKLIGYCKIMNRANELMPSVTAIEDSKVEVNMYQNRDLHYCISSNLEWNQVDFESVTLKKGDVIWFRGNNPDGLDGVNIKITGNAKLNGDIMGLINSTGLLDEITETSIPNYCFKGLFEGSTGLTDASALKLPAETMSIGCYHSMFKGCTKLAKAPKLPAQTMATDCYASMFEGCKSLKSLEVSFGYWDNINDQTTYGHGTNIGIGDGNVVMSFTNNWLKDVAKEGNLKCPAILPEKIGDSFVPKGWTMNGNVLFISVSVDLPDILTVITGEDLHVTGSASDPCTVIVEVDGSTHQTIKDATAFTINLPTDVIGNHSVKVYVSGHDKGAQTFSYKVEKKPDTPLNPSAQLPSVSGTEIDQQNNVSGSTPNVSGQNVDQQYNSGGNAPDIKGQNLNQNYNGGGNAPDIKGTNL